jgi:hypothetical protein
LILVCHAFARVRTSVPMRVEIELFVIGHSTVKQSAWRLNLFFEAGTLTSAVSRLGRRRVGAVPTGQRNNPITSHRAVVKPLTRHPFLCRRPHATVGRTGVARHRKPWPYALKLRPAGLTPRRPMTRADRVATLEEARRGLRRAGTIARHGEAGRGDLGSAIGPTNAPDHDIIVHFVSLYGPLSPRFPGGALCLPAPKMAARSSSKMA